MGNGRDTRGGKKASPGAQHMPPAKTAVIRTSKRTRKPSVKGAAAATGEVPPGPRGPAQSQLSEGEGEGSRGEAAEKPAPRSPATYNLKLESGKAASPRETITPPDLSVFNAKFASDEGKPATPLFSDPVRTAPGTAVRGLPAGGSLHTSTGSGDAARCGRGAGSVPSGQKRSELTFNESDVNESFTVQAALPGSAGPSTQLNRDEAQPEHEPGTGLRTPGRVTTRRPEFNAGVRRRSLTSTGSNKLRASDSQDALDASQPRLAAAIEFPDTGHSPDKSDKTFTPKSGHALIRKQRREINVMEATVQQSVDTSSRLTKLLVQKEEALDETAKNLFSKDEGIRQLQIQLEEKKRRIDELEQPAGDEDGMDSRKKKRKSSKATMEKNIQNLEDELDTNAQLASGSDEEKAKAMLKNALYKWLKRNIDDNVRRLVHDIVEIRDGSTQVESQKWDPPFIRVTSRRGRGTVQLSTVEENSGTTSSSSGRVLTGVPGNPVAKSVRSLSAGGLYGGRGGDSASYINDVLEEWIMGRVREGDCIPSSPETEASLSEDDKSEVACDLANLSPLISMAKDKLARNASNFKRSLTLQFSKACFPGLKTSGAMSYPKQLAFAVGGAGESFRSNLSSARNEIFEEWRHARKNKLVDLLNTHSSDEETGSPIFDDLSLNGIEATADSLLFGAWRKCTVRDLQKFSLILYEDGLSEDSSDDAAEAPTVGMDDWESSLVPRSLYNNAAGDEPLAPHSESTGGDLLFKNSHSSRAMVGFMGRVLGRDRTLPGDTSILSIARADAWIGAYYTMSARPAAGGETAGNSGTKNMRFNHLFEVLLPHALISLTQELRLILKDSRCLGTRQAEREMKKPFSTVQLDKIQEEVRNEFAASEAESAPDPNGRGDGVDQRQRAFNERVKTRADETFPESYAIHRMNLYSTAFRTATVCYCFDPKYHTRRETDEANLVAEESELQADDMDYLLVRPEYIKDKVCPWIGNVLDAYIGQSLRMEEVFHEMETSADI